jgi:uncharacterized protein (TIGR02246 family)
MASISEDRDAIRDLYARYCFHIDTGTAEQWAALFTPQGEFGGVGDPVIGTEALTAFASGSLASGMNTHHLVTNEVIDVQGDSATGSASLALYMSGSPALIGRYQDSLERVDGQWRFASRLFVADSPPAS